MSQSQQRTHEAVSGPSRHDPNRDPIVVVAPTMKQLYPLDNQQTVVPEIDIVLVPGLDLDPEESWVSQTTHFNWTTEALVKDFPKSRLLLYRYSSEWMEKRKANRILPDLAMAMLTGLQNLRHECQQRPIAFIGHGIGGFVIAKAIVFADRRRDKFPILIEAIAAATFFGTPFGAAHAFSVGAMYSYAANKIESEASPRLLGLMRTGDNDMPKLLNLMTVGDESIRQLTDDFMSPVLRLTPMIKLLCFYEEQPTDFSRLAGLSSLSGVPKFLVPQEGAEGVNRNPGALYGIDQIGLACDHLNLVKFDGHKDERWTQSVRDPLRKLIHAAPPIAKLRLDLVRDIEPSIIITKIMNVLDGAKVHRKRHALRREYLLSSWITTEDEYTQWLAESHEYPERGQFRNRDCLWIRGPEGRGKTSAALSVVDSIKTYITDNAGDTTQDPVLLAYFFCDTVEDYNTAEAILRSLITQLIQQQVRLARHVKPYVERLKEGSQSRAWMTVENLWQILQDMLVDHVTGRKVVFVISNIHCLPEDSESTIKFMKFLNIEVRRQDDKGIRRVPTRWLITSRETHDIQQALKVLGVRLVDLQDEKYSDQVRNSLMRYAKLKTSALKREKKYSKALSYFASSLIGRRAPNTQWIDFACALLRELKPTSSDLPVRRALETMPQDLKSLINQSWLKVFQSNEQESAKIKEMLRALVLTFEDPSEAELGVLAGMSSNEKEKTELHGLIEKCRPLVSTTKDGKIGFMNSAVQEHLYENAKDLLSISDEDTKWQHGVLALRAFSHLKERYEQPENADENAEKTTRTEDDDHDTEANEKGCEIDDKDSESGAYEMDEDSFGEEDEDDRHECLALPLPYMVKHWLKHASKATTEIADELSADTDFWKLHSHHRQRWLVDYCKLMPGVFRDFDPSTFSGLHVATSLGSRQLITALARGSEHEDFESEACDSVPDSLLHLAAYFGRCDIVEELLDRGAPIDDGDEIGKQTPLHMAALSDHVGVMRLLIQRGANVNAIANDIGPVINAAIITGNVDALKLLVEHGVSLTVDREDLTSPLTLAAILSNAYATIFHYITLSCSERLPAVEFSKALVMAAEAGKLEVFRHLLGFEHDQSFFQSALNAAAVAEPNLKIVTSILEMCPGLDCSKLFNALVASSRSHESLLLQKLLSRAYASNPITTQTLNASLYKATELGKAETVKLLLDFHANPNATGEEHGNALTAAAYNGNMSLVKMLLDAGADVNAPKGYAIQIAAKHGHYIITKELLKRGADVNAMAKSQSFGAGTALQGATETGHTEIVQLLLEAGADANGGSGEFAPPIVAATRGANVKMLELLIKAKPKLDVFGGPDMVSPLTNAAAFMPVSSVKLLIDAGADINLADQDGATALIKSSIRGDKGAVECLLKNGADILCSSSQNGNALQAALGGDMGCLRLLVDHVSDLLNALRRSADNGNPVAVRRGSGFDEEPQAGIHGGNNRSNTGSRSHGAEGNEQNNANTIPVSDRNTTGGPSNNHEQHENLPESADNFESEAPTEVPDEDETTDVASAFSEDRTEIDASSRTRDSTDRLEAVSRLSRELTSALGHHISLFDQAPYEGDINRGNDSSSVTDSPQATQKHMVGSQRQESDTTSGGPVSFAIEPPDQISMTLKPAPRDLHEHIALLDQAPLPSPRTPDIGHREPSTNADGTATPTPAYHLAKEETQYQQERRQQEEWRRQQDEQWRQRTQQQRQQEQHQRQQELLQADQWRQQIVHTPVSPPSAHAQQPFPPSVVYQGPHGHSYQSSQSSQTSNATMAGNYQHVQYGDRSPYDDLLKYKNNEMQNPGRQSYVPYHPDIYQQNQQQQPPPPPPPPPPQQQQQQQQYPYGPEQVPLYRDPAYDERYRNYYASLQAAQQQLLQKQQEEEQQMQQHQEQQQQQQWNGPATLDAPRSALRNQRSAFFTDGVKKMVGNGFLHRRHGS
ncbi:hypothetical protein GGR50DRAFT_702209 [Xylaria sp. CBS 124048]|nr:hypothetical protein GGR50DRAFT_702209 [Xylaria sp. CBS 124048]